MLRVVEMKSRGRGLLSALAVAAIAVAGCGGGSGTGGVSAGGPTTGGYNNGGPGPGDNGSGTDLSLASKAGVGKYLVTSAGRALYYFALDVPASGAHLPVSHCGSDCLPFWPVFHVDAPVVGDGLTASDFGEFVRSDGAKQTTFKGWPLYYFAGDTSAGDTKGDDLGEPRPTDLWFVIKDPFYAALILTKDGGPVRYLADPAGRALYVFPEDIVGTGSSTPISACADAGCLATWPVFAAGAGTLPTGFDPAKLTSFTRPDGTKQSAFDGHPLYYFAGDVSPGDASGGGVHGFVVADPAAL